MIKTLCKAVVCGLIPVLSCVLYCVFVGQPLNSIYLPNTACSDDMHYYKMVEGMVDFGSPLGYFGFNESHALVSSFGAWSPVLLLPWYLWGKIFGWEYASPIICNICVLSVGFAVFAALAKPAWKQVVSIALLFFIVTPYARYELSGMPEAICYSLVMIMYGIVYDYFANERVYKLILIFLLVTVLSLMRPYFMVFLLLPGIMWVRRSKMGAAVTALFVILDLAGYVLITHYFAAPYFYSSMATDFIDAFRNDGFFAGCVFLLHKIYDKWIIIRWDMSLGVRQGFTDGQIYFACCVAMLLLLIWLLGDLVKIKRRSGDTDGKIVRNLMLEADQLLSFVIMLLAIIVLYQIPEGSRHLLVFLLGFIIVGAMRDNRSLEKSIVPMAVFLYLFVIRYDDDSGYRVPYADEDVVREVEHWSDAFSSCIRLDHADAPSYGNVVDWVISDVVGEEVKEIPWKVLFALPEGTGISCCVSQYITENIDGLNSRYIIAVPDGQVDRLCQEREMDMLLRDTCFVLYQND
ncbi:MAG: hypothetical protein NC331_16110 [Lachnospiraceae bacterium]|nr:hypothetical protein [Lachnospiraceae bacterium]MCM1240877.1 hypothetical protein [Lachnospiraceae bacterium]